MEFTRPEYWSGLPFLSRGDLPNPGIKPGSPALQADSLPSEPNTEHVRMCVCIHIHTYKDWGNASISQETPKLPADHQKPSVIYKTDSLEQTVQEIRPANTLTLDFWPPEL